MENPANVMLEKLYGDPCMPPAWEGLTCEKRNSNLAITKLDLSSMNLHGPLPSVIGDLAELRELDVQKNKFTGSIPESFSSLQHLSKLSISCNPTINSQLPPGLSDKKNLAVENGSCVAGGPSRAQNPQRNIYVLGPAAGGSVAFSVALGIFFTCFYKCARPSKKQNPVMKSVVFSKSSIHEPSMIPSVKSFSLQYIEKATSNYSILIGEGGFGAVYRGTLPHGEEVAVKVRSATSTQGTREFDNEVTLLSAVRHENLVPLLGYCCENDQQILVYPFMSNGSLQDRLYGEASKRKVLDWPTRLSIALGAARGLMFLHSFAGRCIIHRDVKSSNMLLDHSMCGKVADFGFSKYAPQEGDSAASLEVRGTAGYLDPEYYSTQQLSTKSDVFSFGIVLLEIVTGREPLNVHRPRSEWSLVEWVKPFIRESRIEEIVDPSIKGGYHAEAMWRVVEAALTCIEPFSTYRPSMVDIVRELEDALIIENNASAYMRSIESFGGSNRFISIERKMPAASSSPPEPSPNYCKLPAPLPSSSEEEDDDKENIDPHTSNAVNMDSSSEGGGLAKAFLDDEAEEEDDSDHDLMRFEDNEGDDESDADEVVNDLIATGYEEAPVDHEKRNQLHQKWLEQQDAAGTNDILQRLKYGKKQRELTCLHDERDENDDHDDDDFGDESGDEKSYDPPVTNDARQNSRKAKQMIAHMFTDADNSYVHSDDEESEQILLRQRILKQTSESSLISPVDNENSREVLGLIKKLNIAPVTKKRGKTVTSSFDLLVMGANSNSFSKSSFLNRTSSTSLPSLHKQASTTVRTFIFGRDDSNSRSGISPFESVSDMDLKENHPSRSAASKVNCSSQFKSTAKTKSEAHSSSASGSLFQILRHSSVQFDKQLNTNRTSHQEITETQAAYQFSAFGLGKRAAKVDQGSHKSF